MWRRHAARATAIAALLAGAALVAPAAAQATASWSVEQTYTGTSVQYGWDRVERIYDSSSGFGPTGWPADGRMEQFGQRQTFFGNTGQPATGKFLLYYGTHWSTNAKATPVLLVTGAFAEADGSWADPAESRLGCGVAAASCPTTGTMQLLDGQGYKVFAVNFANGAGDNFYWAEQIYDAIQRVKAVTGASKVDIVAWSKGTIASRMYVSSMRRSWGTAYAGDVRKLVLVGGMGGGWDWTFRHGRDTSYLIYPECDTTGAFQPLGASAHTWLYCGGAFNVGHPELTIYNISGYGDPFVGIRQMLARLDGTHPLGSELDAWTTYYGGWGYLNGSYSNGIDYAMGQTPGPVIGPLRTTYTVPSAISTYLLCGTANDIPSPWPNEVTPSDGTVFTDSCDDTTGIANVPAGGNVQIARNHLRLVWDSAAESQIASWLG
jgi:hypothetical protein